MLDGGLGLEQRREGLRLAIGEQDGVVLRADLAVLRAGPRAGVARDSTAPRLALDEPEALLGQDEQIDLVDGPVIGLELEVGPRPVRIVVGQTRADEVQTTPFPLVLRRRDDLPAWRFHEIPARPTGWRMAATLPALTQLRSVFGETPKC